MVQGICTLLQDTEASPDPEKMSAQDDGVALEEDDSGFTAAMSVSTSLPTGIGLTCHSSGMFVFRDQPGPGTVCQRSTVLRAVFQDGSVAVPLRQGKWMVRYVDGSTCEQLIDEDQPPNVSADKHANPEWVSTGAEGQRVALRPRAPQPPGTGEDDMEGGDGEAV